MKLEGTRFVMSPAGSALGLPAGEYWAVPDAELRKLQEANQRLVDMLDDLHGVVDRYIGWTEDLNHGGRRMLERQRDYLDAIHPLEKRETLPDLPCTALLRKSAPQKPEGG